MLDDGGCIEMIQGSGFVEAARQRGVHWYAGVPCSFLTPFIDYVINDERLTYISQRTKAMLWWLRPEPRLAATGPA